jgi:hypothetical protein
MQQQEIDVVASQVPKAFVDERGKPALRLIGDPHFRGCEWVAIVKRLWACISLP